MRFKDNICAAYVRGDSMEPTLFDDDIIIFDNFGYDGTDGIYAINYKGAGFVKRLQRDKDCVKIISDNKIYEPMFENGESEDFRIVGKVRYVLGSVLLAVVGELLGTNTKVDVVDRLDSLLPKGHTLRIGLQAAMTTLSDSSNNSVANSRKLVVVRELLAIHHTGAHLLLGNKTEGLHTVDNIVERATL